MDSHRGSGFASRRSFLNTSAGALGGLALASALGLARRAERGGGHNDELCLLALGQ